MHKLLLSFAGGLALTRVAVATSNCSLYPNIADTSHATPALVEFLSHYFHAKSLHDANAWISDFDTSKITYIDAVLGLDLNTTNFEVTLRALAASWTPDAKSYPLRIIGDMDSAVVFLEDTPALFGSELRGIASIDMENGKVIREIDYWDGRRVPLTDQRVPNDQYPTDFRESDVKKAPDPVLQGVVNDLHEALSTGNSSVTAPLFNVDAVLEDRTTRTRIEGRLAIERYLARASSRLPYGVGATIRHVVGSAQGGGYEWIGGPGAAARNGITAIELDENYLITLLVPLWDASRASDATMVALAGLEIEP